MTRYHGLAAAVACLLLQFGPAVGALQQDSPDRPTFRVSTRLVELDLRVTDPRGRFVPDLTTDDFAVFEDGEAREIAAVSLVTLPRLAPGERESRASPADAAHGITTNATRGGRAFVMIIGRVAYREAPRFQWIARRFVERYLEPDDRLAIIHVGYPGKDQALTSDRRPLLESIARACGPRFPADWLQRYETCPSRGSDLGVLREVLASLGAAGGPRTHVLFISGTFMNVATASEIAQLANASHATLYVLDPGGLPALDLTDEAGPTGGRSAVIGSEAATARRLLARETGGIAITGSNNWAAAFDRAMDDSSAYYLLAYYAAATADDARDSRVDVRVRRDDLSVRWRTNETTARAVPGPASRLLARGEVSTGLSPRLLDALRSPFPVVALPVAMFTSVFKGQDQDTGASVLLGIAVGDGSLDVGPDVRLDVAHTIAAPGGDVQGTGKTFSLALDAEAQMVVARRGQQYYTRIQLEPGRHQLRVAASQGGTTGSVVAHVEVPDFTADPIAMSGLVLATATGDEPTLQTDAAVARALQRVPTMRRRFARDDELLVYGELYLNDAALRPAIAVTVAIAMNGETERLRHEAELEQLDPRDAGRFTYTARIPLQELEPGGYAIAVEARPDPAAPLAAQRQTWFEVERETKTSRE